MLYLTGRHSHAVLKAQGFNKSFLHLMALLKGTQESKALVRPGVVDTSAHKYAQLTSQTQLFDQALIAPGVFFVQVIQQFAPLINHSEQTTS